nr:hypothetical protein [Tanacetum cinerariifolium]
MIQGMDSYEFVLANKRCVVVVEVFRKILDICLRVKGEEFTEESVDVSDESEPEPAKKKTGNRSTSGVVIQDTPSAPKPKPATLNLKLKGFPDESTIISPTSSEGTGTKPGVLDEEKDNDGDANDEDEDNDHISDIQGTDDEDEDDDHINDIQGTNYEDAETESDKDEILNYKIQVHKDVDVKMVKALTVKRESKEKDEITDATKVDVKKTVKEKNDAELARNAISDYQVKESTKLPLPSSRLFISSGFESEKSALEIRKIKKEQAEKQKISKYTIKYTDKTTLKEFDLISALYQTMNENKSFNRNLANHALYHAFIVTDMVKNHKRQHDDEEENKDPSVGPKHGKKTKRRRTKELESSMKPSISKETSKGKAPSKSSKTDKSVTTKKPIEEPIAEVIDNLTQAYSVGPLYELLKGTCTSNIKLKYNMKECFKALTDKLDWNNPAGDHCPFYLTKPPPLKGRPCCLTVAAEYFFNNDLKFQKSSYPKKSYTTSITKTKAAWYEIVGIEDMVPMLWSATKGGYNKDSKKGIKH